MKIEHPEQTVILMVLAAAGGAAFTFLMLKSWLQWKSLHYPNALQTMWLRWRLAALNREIDRLSR